MEPAIRTTPPLNYRPEIDGLRAVAVLVVVFFHAKLGCAGGYVGVDVFFVISGFLITSLILRDLHGSGFRALDFWERRIRRIAPALVVAVAATLIAAWFLFLPDDFDRLGRAVVAQTLLVANVYHWRISGYFGPDAETLPLLHTWSLAVEEQFYILLPIALVLVGYWRRAWLSLAIALACVGSFALGVWATPRHPSAAFYLLPTRAWELLLGALLAAYPAWGRTAPRWSREAIGFAGLGAIVVSVALFDSATPFPGASALLPCLGSAAFIWANRAGLTAGGRLLSWKPVVFIGQVSYSFYLLHWPVLMFSFYWFQDELTWDWRLGLIAATFLLAVGSWALVETPVRKKRVFGERRMLFSATAGAMLLLLAGGQIVHVNQGFPSRLDGRTLDYAAARHDSAFLEEMDVRAAESGNFTTIGAARGPVACLVWGDSFAMAMMPAVDAACREHGVRGFAATRSSTAPLLNLELPQKNARNAQALEFNAAVVRFAIERRVRTVVMVAKWTYYAAGRSSPFEQCLTNTVDTLTSAGLEVVIVGEVPRQPGDVPLMLGTASMSGRDVRTIGVTLADHRERNSDMDAMFQRLAGPHVVVLDPAPYLMDETGLLRAEFDGMAVYRDAYHLSVKGALRLKPLFTPVFEKVPRDSRAHGPGG